MLLASKMVVAIQDASGSLSLDCGRREIFGCDVLAYDIQELVRRSALICE